MNHSELDPAPLGVSGTERDRDEALRLAGAAGLLPDPDGDGVKGDGNGNG